MTRLRPHASAAIAILTFLSACVTAARPTFDTSADTLLAVSVRDGAFSRPGLNAVRAALTPNIHVRPLGGAIEARWSGNLGVCVLHAATDTPENDNLIDLFLGCHFKSAEGATATLAHWLDTLHGQGLTCCTDTNPQGPSWSCACYLPNLHPRLAIEAMLHNSEDTWTAGLNLSSSPILRTHLPFRTLPTRVLPNPGMQRTRYARR